MSKPSLPFDSNTLQAQAYMQDFEKLNSIVSKEFQIEEGLIEHNIPTFYLEKSQKTKRSFLVGIQTLCRISLNANL